MTRDLNRARREIDANTTRPAARKLQQVSTHSAANLEQSRVAKLLKSHQPRHPRPVFQVTMSLYLVEKLATAEFVFTIIVGTAWILPPLLACANFFFSQSCQLSCNPV